MKFRIISCGIIILIIACSLYLINIKKLTSTVESNHSQDSFIIINSPLDLSTYSDAIVYFGRETCTSCLAAEIFLIPLLQEYHTAIYYFNTDMWRNDESYEAILQKFNIKSVPTLIKITDGKIVDGFSMVSESGKINTKDTKDFLDKYL